jgi:hypothetical protein
MSGGESALAEWRDRVLHAADLPWPGARTVWSRSMVNGSIVGGRGLGADRPAVEDSARGETAEA